MSKIKFLFLCILLFMAPTTYGAISVVSTKSNQAVGTSVAVTIGTTVGDLLVTMVYSDVASGNVLTVTDSASQTWTQVINSPATVGNGVLVMFYKPNSAVVTSVTGNATSSGTTVAVVYEISGAATGTPFDANTSNAAKSSNSATGTSLGSGTLSTNNANDILLYAVGEGATSGGWTPGSGFSLPTGSFISGGGRGAMSNKIVSATQSSVTTTMSWSSSGADRLGIFAAFSDTNQGVHHRPPVIL